MNIDEAGNIPLDERPHLVLLSGGLDSTAALAWAVHKAGAERVRALFFYYGQPAQNDEVCAAGRAADAFGVPLSTVAIADALRPFVGASGLLAGVEDHVDGPGVNPAFVPGRNLVFLATAASHARGYFPDATRLVLVVGFCREDASGYPDCREEFVRSASEALTVGSGIDVHVAAPWVRLPKTDILRHFANSATLPLLARSWSCYRGTTPCGTCTACVVRQRAFAGAALVLDAPEPAKMVGGDPHRDARLK